MTSLVVESVVPWLLLMGLLMSCSVEDSRPHCGRASDCMQGEACYLGFCVLGAEGTRADTQGEDGGEASSGAGEDASVSAVMCAAPLACYAGPAATRGVGACRAGSRACVGGVLGTCEGSRTPVSETCANEGLDDDCNGIMDDVAQRGADCDTGASDGACARGSLRCVPGEARLRCVAAASGEPELCNRRDDDCDGKIDEGLNLETDPAHCGACDQRCASGQACRAGRCAGAAARCDTDSACAHGQRCCGGACVELQSDAAHCGKCANACDASEACCAGACVELQSDAAHCGKCTNACGASEACCAGACVDTRSDVAHCGGCGAACSGELPGCCGGACTDLARDADHCGACDAACGSVLGGLLCTCRQQASGKPHCEGTVLDLCL